MGILTRSKAKGSSRVGPIIYSLYEQIDSDNQVALAKFLSCAPSGSELVATYQNASLETARTILSAFQKAVPARHGVIAAEVYGDGFAVCIKGDFSGDALAELAEMVRQSGEKFGLEVNVASGRFDADHLRELN